MPLKLYDGARSPNARKVRLFAAELGLSYESIMLDFKAGEYKRPPFLAKNPNGKVPVLDDDGFLLWESPAILRYLARKHPERGFAPSDPQAQARLDQWMFWWASHPEPALMSLATELLIKPFLGKPANDPNIIGDARASLAHFLPVLDGALAGKEHVLGALSIVDFEI